jgi:hypothetical protein
MRSILKRVGVDVMITQRSCEGWFLLYRDTGTRGDKRVLVD